MLAKVTSGCGFHAQRIGAKVDGVHIIDQDGFLVHDLFQLKGKILFLKLSLELVGKGILAGPVREDVVFKELLGDGAGSFGKMPVLNAHNARTDDALDINAVMVVEAGVLDGYEGVL